MKQHILLIATLLFGCGSGNCQNKPVPVPPVSVVDAGLTTESTVESASPELQGIEWKTPQEVVRYGLDHPELCIMAYFPDAVNGDMTIENETFTNQPLVELLNRTFIAMHFPVSQENADEIMSEFQITKLPALIMAPANDEMVFQVEGLIPPDTLRKAIEEQSLEGKLFEKCVAARSELD